MQSKANRILPSFDSTSIRVGIAGFAGNWRIAFQEVLRRAPRPDTPQVPGNLNLKFTTEASLLPSRFFVNTGSEPPDISFVRVF